MQFCSKLREVSVSSVLPFPALLLLFWKRKIKHSYRILLAKSALLHQEMKHDSECGNTQEGTAWRIKEMLFRGQSCMKLLTVTARYTLCWQRAGRVDAAVSTAFPTRGVRTQSKIYSLRWLFQSICIYNCNISWISYVHQGPCFSSCLNN